MAYRANGSQEGGLQHTTFRGCSSLRLSFLPNSVKYPQLQVWRDTDNLFWEFHRTIQAPQLFFIEWQGFSQIDTIPLNQREKETLGLLSHTHLKVSNKGRTIGAWDKSSSSKNEIRPQYFHKLHWILFMGSLVHSLSTSFAELFQITEVWSKESSEANFSLVTQFIVSTPPNLAYSST